MEEAIEWLPPPSQPTHWLRLRVDLGLERHSGLDSPHWSRSHCQPASPAPSLLRRREPGEGVCKELCLFPYSPHPPGSPSLSPLWVRDDCLLQHGWFPESLIKESVRERPLREPPQNVGDGVFFPFIIHSLIPRSEVPSFSFFPQCLPLFSPAHSSHSHLTFPSSARLTVSSVCFGSGCTMGSPLIFLGGVGGQMGYFV